jgi:hypothetical protein
LTRRHLTLAPLAASQMVRIEDLPLRLPPLIAETAPLKDDGAHLQPSSATVAAEQPAASITDLIKRSSGVP